MIAGELEGQLPALWDASHQEDDYDQLFGRKRKKKKKKKRGGAKTAQDLVGMTPQGQMLKIASKPFTGFRRKPLPHQLPDRERVRVAPIPVDPEPESADKKGTDIQEAVEDTISTAKKLKETAENQKATEDEPSDYTISPGAKTEEDAPPPEQSIHWGWYAGGAALTLLLIGGAIALKVKQNKAAAAAVVAAAAGK